MLSTPGTDVIYFCDPKLLLSLEGHRHELMLLPHYVDGSLLQHVWNERTCMIKLLHNLWLGWPPWSPSSFSPPAVALPASSMLSSVTQPHYYIAVCVDIVMNTCVLQHLLYASWRHLSVSSDLGVATVKSHRRKHSAIIAVDT